MSPNTIKLLLDLFVVTIALYSMMLARKSALGGKFGKAMNLILAGFFVLSLNHILDTVFLANALKEAGHTADMLQSSIVHRGINALGFILISAGFITISSDRSNR